MRREPKQPRAPAARRRSLAVIGAVAVGLAGSALWRIARAPADDAAPTLPVSVAQAPAPGAEVAAMPAPAAPPAPASAGGA